MGRQGLFSVKEITTRFQIGEDDLKNFTSAGLINQIVTNDGKFYTSSDFLCLEVIMTGLALGFSLAELKSILIATTRTDH